MVYELPYLLIFIISSVWRYENGVISEGGHEHGNIGHLLGTIRKDVSDNSLLLLFIEYGYLRAENILCGLLFSGNTLETVSFPDCTELQKITIPSTVTRIGDGAFRGCTGLTSIIMSDNVTAIGNTQFSGCNALVAITCLAMTPPAISDLGIAEETTIYVPKDAIKEYKKDPNWEIYKKQIKAIK